MINPTILAERQHHRHDPTFYMLHTAKRDMERPEETRRWTTEELFSTVEGPTFWFLQYREFLKILSITPVIRYTSDGWFMLLTCTRTRRRTCHDDIWHTIMFSYVNRSVESSQEHARFALLYLSPTRIENWRYTGVTTRRPRLRFLCVSVNEWVCFVSMWVYHECISGSGCECVNGRVLECVTACISGWVTLAECVSARICNWNSRIHIHSCAF